MYNFLSLYRNIFTVLPSKRNEKEGESREENSNLTYLSAKFAFYGEAERGDRAQSRGPGSKHSSGTKAGGFSQAPPLLGSQFLYL